MPRRKRQDQLPLPFIFILALISGVGYSLESKLYLPLIVTATATVAYIAYQVQQKHLRRTRNLALADLHSLSHRDLELHVAAVLDALPGWKAQATRGSSDQGADVIATSPTQVIVAIQVKHYPQRNVGNKAVQEIVASKAIYRASEAVVFTSGPGYTASARELAQANGGRLWTPRDLFELQAKAQTDQPFRTDLLPT